MTESELLRELSRRTSVPEALVGAVFDGLRQMVREGAIHEDVLHDAPVVDADMQFIGSEGLAIRNPSDETLVDDLIARARKHPLGTGFLLTGFLGSVAIALGAHAFTVEAARERLRKELENEKKDNLDS